MGRVARGGAPLLSSTWSGEGGVKTEDHLSKMEILSSSSRLPALQKEEKKQRGSSPDAMVGVEGVLGLVQGGVEERVGDGDLG